MSRVDILGVCVDDITREGLERAIIESVEMKRKEVFAYANVHAINLAQTDRSFREFLNKASVVYCDGEGVRLGARILGHGLPPRTALTRWIWDLGGVFEERGISVYLLGGREGTVAAATNRLYVRYPRLNLVGYHHGYFDRTGHENTVVLDSINNASPNVVFVGFGMPEQERWIDQNFSQLCVNAIIPCGGMIDYLSGEVSVAPRWMSESGLEWLHRLTQDPARLWWRYVVGNPTFMLKIFRERIRERRRR
jgi:N-acetylglucosaminyldiphosphoundecaprenol N-acetyl-beta-D-mannosaminyltransferase